MFRLKHGFLININSKSNVSPKVSIDLNRNLLTAKYQIQQAGLGSIRIKTGLFCF